MAQEGDAEGYRALLDSLDSLIFVLDESSRTFLYANAQFHSLMHASSCCGKSVSAFIDEDKSMSSRRRSFLDGALGASDLSREIFCPEMSHWFKLSVTPLQWAGRPAVSYLATDTTEEKRTLDIRQEKDIGYELLARRLSLVVWEYDKETHTNTMLQEGEQSDFHKLGFPRVQEDVPYSLVPYVDEKDVDKFIRLYTSIDAGLKYAEAKVLLTSPDKRESRYQHIILTSFTDYLGRERVIGFAIDISSTQREEEKYRRLKKQLSDVMEISYESALLDLAQNLCHEHKCLNEEVWKTHDAQTADGFLYAVGMDIGDSKLQSEFFDRFSLESMRLDFINGIQQIVMEFPTASAGINMKWLRITANLSMNPETGSIEALTYLMDISEEKKHSFIVNTLASESFHYIAFLYTDTDELEFFSNSTDIYYIPESSSLSSYEALRRIRMEHFILSDEERTAYREATGLDVIRGQLAAKSSYAVSFNQTVGGKESHMQLIFTWASRETEIILILCMDVTDSYEKEQKYLADLRQAVSNAENAANSKMDFISRISHDIRTPLSAITSMTDFAFEDIDDREKLLSDLEKINSSNHFLMSLINDVLDVSKIDSGRIELVPEPYHHEEFIADIKNMFVPLCEQKGVRFTVVTDGVLISSIIIDKVRLNQIVLNLVSNAYKYTPKGGSITLTVNSRKLDAEKCIIDIDVADTGIGMGESFQKKMFTPFTQDLENPERQKLRSGTGIGLYIVKKLVILMGGTIDVKSELHKGTQIHITLKTAYQETDGGTVRQAEPASWDKLSGRVLLAEDNEINTEIALRTLHGMGLEADTAENGAVALKRFKESEPGRYICILMDIQMPILSGYEATMAIRALDRADAKTIPIFALSANAYSEAVQQSKEAGMNGHISKPIDKNILYKALQEAAAQAADGAQAEGVSATAGGVSADGA